MKDAPIAILPPDVTIRNDAGEVLMFSWPDFVTTICEGAACFICGRSKREVAFNDEHIVPNWALHAFGLHGKKVTLPNGQRTVYGNYTIPCCEPCNTEMARRFEDDMSALVRAGPGAIHDQVAKGGGFQVFNWMALIFLKLHLKDRRLKMHLDRRLGDDPISAGYIWENMHHLHAVARAFHIGAAVQREATGSLYVFPIDAAPDAFDLLTFTEAQTLYIQLGTTGLIAVFDDAHAATNRVMWIIDRITGPLSPFQGRNMAVHYAMANLDLENRPRFYTLISEDRTRVTIGGSVGAAPIFRPYDQALFGDLMTAAFPVLPAVNDLDPEEARARLATGDMNFLLDEQNRFVADHTRRSGLVLPPDE